MAFVTAINSASSHYGKVDTGKPGYYLDWITDAMRSKVTDPGTLPEASSVRRRILWITDTLGAGGAERLVETGARLCAQAGHQVWIWALQRPADGAWCMDQTGGIGVGYGSTADCLALVKRERIEVAILSNLAGSAMCQRLDQAGVACIGIPYGLVEWNLRRIAVPGVRDHLAALWAYRDIAAGLLQKGYDFPAYRFLAPMDLDAFEFGEMRMWQPPFQIAYCGRMSNEKNLHALLELFARVQARTSQNEVALRIIGGVDPHSPQAHQEYWATCERLMLEDPLYQKLDATGCVVRHGYIGDAEHLMNVMRCCHFLALTSDFEGEPVVFLEAMALGTLCVGRRMSEIAPLLDGCGILSTPKTERMSTAELDEMADAIVAAIRAPAETYYQMACDARRRVEREHDGHTWIDNLERIVTDVLSRRAPATLDNQVHDLKVTAPLRTISRAPGTTTKIIQKRTRVAP